MTSAVVDAALALTPDLLESALARVPEDQWFERKSARVSPRDLAVPLVAMANADGGVIVVGMHDGVLEDVPPQRRNAIRQAAMDFTQPPVRMHVEELTVGGDVPRTMIVLRVEPGETVHHTHKGDCYLRIGDESRRLSAAQERELIYDRGAAQYEASPTMLGVDDLDSAQLTSYAALIGVDSPQRALAARDLIDRQGRVAIAAALLFDERPQRELPNALVRILKYGADERGVGDAMTLEAGGDTRIEGSIPQQIREAAKAIEPLMPKWEQLGPAGLFEATSRIPRDAWLEGLVNAVVHRSYSMMGDHVRFEIFPNRVEITSPGRFPGLANPSRPLEVTRYARNPRIARVCADLGITRELGEGIRRLFSEMRRRGMADPVYEQTSSSVKLTLLAVDALPAEVNARLTSSARAILTAMRLHNGPLGTGELADLAGVTRMTATRALASLEQEGIVTWRGNSKRDPRATWALGQL